jgi:hypothetical protein
VTPRRAAGVGARWRLRLVSLLLCLAVALVLLTLMDFEPRLLQTSLLVTVVFAVGWLVVDTLDAGRADWGAPAEALPGTVGTDRTLATYTRVIGDQLVAGTPGPALRDRLVALARDRDPTLADPVLRALAEAPPHRMPPAEIDDVLRRIEQQ